MNIGLVAIDKTGLGEGSREAEQLLDELDIFRAVFDEWLILESIRNTLDVPLDMSSTLRVIVERFASLDEAARRVLRP